jgi:hypothetical protein
MPAPDREIRDRPEPDRHPSGIDSVGTCTLSQSMFLLGTRRFTVGGMIFLSRMRQAFSKETRKAAASK